MKSLFILCLIGCVPDVGSLSIIPNTKYQPDSQASTLSYLPPQTSSDLYLNNSNIININGLIGEFGIIIKNNSSYPIHNLEVAVIANDISKIDGILPARIYHTFFWGNSIFNFQTPTQLPNAKPVCDNVLAGNYAIFDGDDLEAGESVIFSSVVIGDAGLKLHLEVYGESSGNYIVSCGNETTIQWNE